MTNPKAKLIADLNDDLRASLMSRPASVPGRIVMTSGFAALSMPEQFAAMLLVKTFSAFTQNNDPYGEHDFGCVTLTNGQRVNWKIDYYQDAECVYGAEDASDPAASYRVLVLMLAEEY